MGVKIIPFGVTDKMKEDYLLAAITAECEAEDRAGVLNIPYFMRARQRVDAIKLRGELDKEYRNYKEREKEHGKEQNKASKN